VKSLALGLAFAALAAGASFVQPAAAASFSCEGDDRLNAAERTICDSPRLGALDERLDSWYRRALVRAGYSDQTAEVRGAQRRWIASRNACGSSFGCLKAHYTRRIRELKNYVEHV